MKDFSGPVIESASKARFRTGWREAKSGKSRQPDRDRFYYLGFNSAMALSHNDWESIWDVVKPKS
jgi:hypothetical protein